MNSNKPTTGSKIPDLYELLNLAAKEKDEQLIKAAMREFAERVKQIKSPDAAKQAAKLFAIAKQNLLDPVRKAAYDSLWDKVYGKRMPEMSAEEPTDEEPTDEEPKWDLAELNGLLPQSDAQAPLDLAAFLDSTDSLNDQRSTEDLDRDFQRLVQLLGGEIERPAAIEATAPLANFISAVPANSAVNAATNSAVNSADAPPIDFSAPASIAMPPVVPRTAATASGTRKKRKNRDSSLLWMIGGGVTVLLGVLAVLVVMLNRKLPTQDVPQRALVVAENTKTKTSAGQASKEAPIKGSGLPQPGSGLPQPGEGTKSDGATLEESLAMGGAENMDQQTMNPQSMDAAKPSDTAMVSSMPETAAPATTTPATTTPATTTPATTTPQTTSPATAAMPAMTSGASSGTPLESEPEPTVSLTDKEKAEWKRLLVSARQSLGKSDFEKARESLEKATTLAKSSPQKAQLGRLNTVLPLVERFHEAMKSAASEMQASEVFTAGSQDISFVEASEDRFIVRIRGANKRYQWNELPIVLAYGLVDLKLDQGPETAAAKAAFAAVHSKINGTAKEEARKLMQVAAAAKVVPADTQEIFDDDYSLD